MSVLTPEELAEIQASFPRKEKPPVPPKEKVFQSETVQEMRERLEIRRLQIEIEKLEKPDTSIDYYSKMLELQKESFKAQLDMLQQQQNLKIELEKLKIAQEVGGGDIFEDLIAGLLPLLPELIKKKQEMKGGEKMIKGKKIPNAVELEEYKAKIKAGLISFEQAYADFLKTYPQMKNQVPESKFREEFDKIKNSE